MASAAQSIGSTRESEQWEVPDTPIEVSIPHRTREKGASRHFGFFPFFAKKPWPVVQEYIKHYTQPGEVVCDPFAGSGVTPVEALILGRRAVAGDINPVARFITQMTAIAPVDLNGLRAAYFQVEQDIREPIIALDELSEANVAALLRTLDYPRDSIPNTVRRANVNTVDELHTPRQLAGLTMLRDAIARVEEPVARDLLRVALANTVRYCNTTYILPYDKGQRRSPYRGDAAFLRRFSYSPASVERFYELPVWPTFELRFKAVLDAKAETNRLIDGFYGADTFTLTDVPAAHIHEVTGEGRADYCFTDPPYSNDIHFLDLSTLWASWLGMEITDEARRDELMLHSTKRHSRDDFTQHFAKATESIARALRPDRWLTLVYKHRDLSLWRTVIQACEDNGLRYINAVWQDVKIPSTRQIENPNINPKGDMYLNFRKMVWYRFDQVYGSRSPVPLPTLANYVEHEMERLVVAYLGADIELLVAGVIQQVLNSRTVSESQDDFAALGADIGKVLGGSRFITWKPNDAKSLWILNPDAQLDSSLDATDRARYHIFEFLRERGEATEGEVRQHLLTRLAQSSGSGGATDDVEALLHNVATEIAPHRWRLDLDKLLGFKQLRLLFQPSQADELRQRLERRYRKGEHNGLRVDLEGIALLRDRLREANSANPKFDSQFGRILDVLQALLRRFETEFPDQIERVIAIGGWALHGIDLRNLPYDDIVFLVVVGAAERPFSLYLDVADRVFSDLGDDDVLVQFRLETLAEWRRAASAAQIQGKLQTLGVPLLVRS